MILLTLVAGVAGLAWYLHRKNDWMHDIPPMPLEEAMRRARTGDLVLFRWRDVSAAHDAFTSFTHAGMVYERDGGKHILETHEAGDTKHMGYESGGVHVYPMRDRVAMYNGSVCFLRLHPSLYNATLSDLVASQLPKYAGIPFNSSFRSYYAWHCLLGAPASAPPGKFCSQFVGLVLQDLGIFPTTADVQCLAPDSFLCLHVSGKPLYTELYRIKN